MGDGEMQKKDNRGRNLNTGESQRTDGSYMYRYTDTYGRRKTLYSWKLVETDKTPQGKKEKPALRTQEKEVLRNIEDGIRTGDTEKVTLNTAFERYMSINTRLKDSTRNNYVYMWNKFVRDDIGKKHIVSLTKTDILRFYNSLIKHGFKGTTLRNMHKLINPALELAVEDRFIRRNPAAGAIKSMKLEGSKKKEALTEKQQEAFFNYVANSEVYAHWLPMFTVLFGTGCRIGEAMGLTWEDIDFKKNIISINHTLYYRPDENRHCEHRITTPKTEKGYRIIPMLADVKKALLEIKKIQMQLGVKSIEVDGYTDFVFRNRLGNIYRADHVTRAIHRIVNDYNNEEIEKAKREKRDAELLPKFSPHIIRHTFCTRFCENETNIKVIQEIMGHSDISTTMNIYATATEDKKREVMNNLDGKIKIS